LKAVPVLFPLLLLLAGPAPAHQLGHSVQTGTAVIVDLRYGDGSPFSYEAAEVFRPGEAIPFLAGRTDANGRLAFVPDRAGDWRIRGFSEDGHGGDFTVAAVPEGGVSAPRAGLWEAGGLAIGLSVLFGLFGLWSLFLRKKP
jgi:nickel transport protein